jgi:molybdopterin converting factor small subunit
MPTGTIRYWAAARDAAGCAEEAWSGATLADVLDAARATRGDRFAAVLALSSYLVDAEPVGTRPHPTVLLVDGAVVEVLPPFAGG